MCSPKNAEVSGTCAKITLLFDKTYLPQGVTVGGLCDHLRWLPIIKDEVFRKILIACELKSGTTDTVEVTVVSTLDILSFLSKSWEKISYFNSIKNENVLFYFFIYFLQSAILENLNNPLVGKTAKEIGDLISNKRTNSSAFAAVIEVKVETAVYNPHYPSTGGSKLINQIFFI